MTDLRMPAVVAWLPAAPGTVAILLDVFVLHRVSGLFLTGMLLWVASLWLLGVFERAFWFGDERVDAECARIDVELDEEAYR